MLRRSLVVLAFVLLAISFPAVAQACGGLIGPRGAVNLEKTTTFAGYHAGVEHYITSFSFAGPAGAKFGSIVPLPGIPSSVERGGDWTLQRLRRLLPQIAFETLPASSGVAGAAPAPPQILLRTKIGTLNITVLKGGGASVGEWARNNGFALSPDAPEVLDFYAKRSPIFAALKFDPVAAAARGVQTGDGTPVHFTIPTPNPWVPLRILALGKVASEFIDADVFLLTDRAPSLLPAPGDSKANGVPRSASLSVTLSQQAGGSLLRDLHKDKGGVWVPTKNMWVSAINVSGEASKLTHDLAIDASGAQHPSYIAAGLSRAVGVPVPAIVIKRPVQRIEQIITPPLPVRESHRSQAPDVAAAMLIGLSGGSLVAMRLRWKVAAA